MIVDRGDPTNADRDPISGANIPPLRPAAGVRVEVTWLTGVPVTNPTAVATTGADGWWHVDIEAATEGEIAVDVRVSAPDAVPYRVEGLVFKASRTRGAGNVVGRWTREPYIAQVGELYEAATGAPISGARITAVARGGVGVAPLRSTEAPMVTFDGGRFLYSARPLGSGDVFLDLIVERDGLAPRTIPGVRLRTQHEWLPPNVTGDLIFRI
jgi:hypothetical protein